MSSLFVKSITIAAIASATIVNYMGFAQAGVLFSDDFNSGASPLWGNESGNWSDVGGVYNALNPASFAPGKLPAYSSLPFDLTDFTIDLDINKIVDGGVFLRMSGNTPNTLSGVLLVTGGLGNTGLGLYWLRIYDGKYKSVENQSRFFLSNPGKVNAKLRIEVKSDNYSAFINDSLIPITTLKTSDFSSGRVALYDYSYRNVSEQTFDNVTIYTSVPEPNTIWGIATMVGMIVLKRTQKRR